MKVGNLVDLEIAVGDSNVLFPMKAMVVARRTRPKGTKSPRGVFLEVIESDADRFKRLCAFADGQWKPGTRRTSPRLRADFPVTYYFQKKFFNGRVRDISQEGLFIRTDEPLSEIGQGVYVKLRPSRLWFPINLSARVCWIDEVDTRKGMGLYCFATPRGLKKLSALVYRLRRKVAI
ncbi:MAG: PilZ domain-containing protein [Deltaproteobacteria bacterium]|nr:PilZ domain-containing protein [Deltaproteobacteria bacterium]